VQSFLLFTGMKKIITTIIFLFFLKTAYSQSELFKTIYFNKNSFRIEKKYYAVLNKIAAKLTPDSSYYIKVFGFADTTGSDEYDDWISDKRSFTVYNYLLSHSKLDTTSAYVASLGKSDDAYDLHFDSAHIQKRCVDIWIVFYKKKTGE
jgi:outer membrane protein OmpA-like peptidoglycan-associated protein